MKVLYLVLSPLFAPLSYLLSGAQLGAEGGGFPCPFLKIKKSAVILEKKVLIVYILMLNLPFRM